jgi:hypothetical protein
MPLQTNEPLQIQPASKFIGLQSYTEAQAAFFYGRDKEIEKLTNLVKLNTLTIVFGKSGTGKTSLLNAGIFPRLRKDYCLPFRIRLEFNDDSPDLVSQIKNTLKTEIDKYGFKVEAYPSNQTLWEYFHKEQLWKSVTPILIFDQFEEIFTLAKKSNRFKTGELENFWEELADLAENSIPQKLKENFLSQKEHVDFNYKNQRVKILFAFREEFLPEFESITAKIPSIKFSRFRLMPMNGHQAYEVITKTWGNRIDAAEAKKIVGFFILDDDKAKPYDIIEIEPSLLSQVCSYIDKKSIALGNNKISAEFLEKYPKETILRSIYDEVFTEGNQAVNSNNIAGTFEKPLNLFAEEKLITDEGYRTKYPLNEQDENLRTGIEVLKTKYFLREDGKMVELTHDVLTPLIKHDREDRRKGIAMAAAKKKANRRALIIVIFSIFTAGLLWYFTTRKAISDREDAIHKTALLQAKLNTDSSKLAMLGDSIQIAIDSLKKLNESKFQNGNIVTSNSGFDDSLQLSLMQNKYAALVKEKYDLENKISQQNAELNTMLNKQKQIDLESNDAKRMIDRLRRQYAIDSVRLLNSQKNFALLQKEFYDYKIKNPAQREYIKETIAELPDTNSLKLDLYYGRERRKVEQNLGIYLIPINSANARIIRNAQIYQLNCDGLNLAYVKDKKTAIFKNGLYTFYDVMPGKYFIKICGYYGGYYKYTKLASGNVTIQRDASPPIR